jgi:hypothetical protein
MNGDPAATPATPAKVSLLAVPASSICDDLTGAD